MSESVHSTYDEKVEQIKSMTPRGNDALLYWFNVAQDAMSAQKRSDERRKEDRTELERLQQYEKQEHKRREMDLLQQTIPDFRQLLSQVRNGDFSMTVQLSFYPNSDRKDG